MSLRVKILINTSAQIINRLALSGSSFLVSLLIAWFFGARGFGDFSKATTYISLFYLFTDFGLNAVILRKISAAKESEFWIISNLFGLRILMGIILLLLSLLLIPFLPYKEISDEGFTLVAKQSMIVLSCLILYQSFLNSVNLIFQKYLRYDLSAIASIVGSVVTVITTFLLLFIFKVSLFISLFGYIAGAIVTSLLLFFYVKKLKVNIVPLVNISFIKKSLVDALPLGLTLIFNLVYFRADVFILTLSRTTPEVGNYAFAYKFFEFAITLPAFFANSIYPVLLNRLKNRRDFLNTITKSGFFLGFLSLITMILLYLAAPFIGIIKSDFIPAIDILRLLSLSVPFFFISSLFMWILITFEKSWLLLKIYLAGMMLNILLNIIFVPVYGVTAAALITGISELLIMIINGYFILKLIKQYKF